MDPKAIRIIPTILANTEEEFDARLARLLPVSKELQIDMMDGRFVPSTGIPPRDLPDLRRWKEWTFEAHIMVERPQEYVEELWKKGFKRVIFHVEAVASDGVKALAALIRGYGMQPILALNPDTPVSAALPHTRDVDGILFLGVHPGFNGAPYVPETPSRVAQLVSHNTNPSLFAQVDGGMTPETVGAVVKAGATRINSGSFVSAAQDPAAAIMELMRAAQEAASEGTPVLRTTLSLKGAKERAFKKKETGKKTIVGAAERRRISGRPATKGSSAKGSPAGPAAQKKGIKRGTKALRSTRTRRPEREKGSPRRRGA